MSGKNLNPEYGNFLRGLGTERLIKNLGSLGLLKSQMTVNPFNGTRQTILTPGKDCPLLLLDYESRPGQYNHMIKLQDQRAVANLVLYLQKNQIEVYLGGGAVANWIFQGRQEYKDLDLLGVACEGGEETSQKAAMAIARAAFENSGIMIGDSAFLVNHGNTEHKMYMGMELDDRFRLSQVPKSQDLEAKSVNEIDTAAIDLSLVSARKFLQFMKKGWVR